MSARVLKIIFVLQSFASREVLFGSIAQLVRALALQARGHRFESYCSHHCGPVVQLVRTLACHARGRRFEPVPGRHFSLFYIVIFHFDVL